MAPIDRSRFWRRALQNPLDFEETIIKYSIIKKKKTNTRKEKETNIYSRNEIEGDRNETRSERLSDLDEKRNGSCEGARGTKRVS